MTHGLKALIETVLPEVVEVRHALHKMPELAGQERRTSAFLRKKLSYLPLMVHPPYLGSDTVADLQTGKPGVNVVLRADIDGLPISETGKARYRSQNPGCMHGCGHDGHAAMLYGAALVLCRLRDELRGNIRFVWQPGEENEAMGKQMVASGVVTEPPAGFVTALHGMPGLPKRAFSFKPGPIMAACAHWHLKIFGRGAHGSMPEKAVDPIYLGSLAAAGLHDLAAKEFSGNADPVVVSIGRFHAGLIDNVIPDTAEMCGTSRFFSKETGAKVEQAMRELLDRVLVGAGAKYELEFSVQYLPTVNDPESTEFVRDVVRKYMMFTPLKKPKLIAEDFSYYLDQAPGVYAFLGLGEECPLLHSSGFDFPDDCLADGIHYFSRLVLELQK